jgi:23S rRNA (adenine2503-C2)-methyltransferase
MTGPESTNTKPDGPALLGMDLAEMESLVAAAGEPAYRARQIWAAVYRERLGAIETISTLPKSLISELQGEGVYVGMPDLVSQFQSQDGTVRYLVRLADGETVETVWMPDGDDGESGDGSEAGEEAANEADRKAAASAGKKWRRATICVSSQVGCAVDCAFCFTASLGVRRSLSAGEIVGQVCAVLNDRGVFPPKDRVNLVFMGMGEPFLNYDQFMKAVRLLVEGVGIPEPRMTVSTAGIVPRIEQLGQEKIRPKLAISLNASNDTLRTELMPINRKWDLEKLIAAAKQFPLRPREKLTFEYVLLGGVNDRLEHAREVVQLLRGLRAKVNLIAWNPGPGIQFQTPELSAVNAFQQVLIQNGIPAFVRRPRGRDIYAACGQLKRTTELVPLEAASSREVG